jgi:Reverse transcriptase (RNA-dependent DNA polymerase)
MSGGKGNTRGTPQGGVASPLLANIYMNRFLKHWRLTGCGGTFHAHVVSYADDFVILSRGHAEEALAWTKAVMTKLGLTINEAKTSLRNARQERFDFLGYSFGAHGLQSGYSSKLLALQPAKIFGPVSMGPTLETLGLRMMLVEDKTLTARTLERRTPRCEQHVRRPRQLPTGDATAA